MVGCGSGTQNRLKPRNHLAPVWADIHAVGDLIPAKVVTLGNRQWHVSQMPAPHNGGQLLASFPVDAKAETSGPEGFGIFASVQVARTLAAAGKLALPQLRQDKRRLGKQGRH